MPAGDLMDSTSNAVIIPEVIAQEALTELSTNLNLGRTVAKDSDLTTQQEGDTIIIPVYSAVESNEMAENGEVVVQKPSLGSRSVTLNHHKEVTIGELDYARSLQRNSTLPGYFQNGILRISEDIEGDLAALWSEFADTLDTQNVTGKYQKVLIDAKTKMTKQRVPQFARKFAYLSPDFINGLLKEEAFLDPKLIPQNQALTEGSVGRVAGFDIFEGVMVQHSGSPGVDRNLAYVRDSMVIATRPQPLPDARLGVQASVVNDPQGFAIRVIRSYDSKKLGNIITMDFVYGVARYDQRLGVEIDS